MPVHEAAPLLSFRSRLKTKGLLPSHVIATGRFHELHVLRRTQVGAFLGNAQGDEVLLPWAHCPADLDRHEVLRVFVYRDSQDRQVATTQEPLITLHGFACLRVKEIASIGAFLDWGLDKDLLVPFREQPKPMRAGQQWVVYLDLDKRSDRLFASAKIDHRLRPAPPELEGTEQVDVLVYEARELGWSVIVNDRYKGLIYANETFKPVRVGEVLTGYVRAVREDGKLDISLEPLGYDRSIDEHVRVLTERLQANDGTLPFTDKSDPAILKRELGLSKKAFKKALGALYKARKIRMDDRGITWIGPGPVEN